VSAYEFVDCEKASHAVVTLCRVLGVSPSGYWAWHKRGPAARSQADRQLSGQIRTIHQASRGTYGVPRVHAALASAGTHCGRKRVARLMRRDGLVGCHRQRRFQTTQRDPQAEPAADLVQRTWCSGPGAADLVQRTWCSGRLRRPPPTHSGSPISPTCPRGMRASSIWP
jgi:transposase InsO family protein